MTLPPKKRTSSKPKPVLSPEEHEKLLKLKQQKLELLEQQIKEREGLPHLHGFPWYEWSWEYFNSTNKKNFLCAANQLGKSVSNWRKAIHWATETSLWPKLWQRPPAMFWYFYPTLGVASVEFTTKISREILPRGDFKNDPKYGWKEEWQDDDIYAIHFNSGVSIFFKSYKQDLMNLQTASPSAIFADEEYDPEAWDEIQARLVATDGYYNHVFTATQGSEFFRRIIEERGPDELFPDAWKRQVSLYDCLSYMDKSIPSPWTKERIKRVEAGYKSQSEIDKRVHGKFVVDEDLKFPAFDPKRNIVRPKPMADGWTVWEGIDVGAGGKSNHPAGIAFVKVNPDVTEGRIFVLWRGDEAPTTNGDIVEKHKLLKREHNVTPILQSYDHASKDFYNVAMRAGEIFVGAEKGQDYGTDLMNTLFKLGMLVIESDCPEKEKLINELRSLRKSTPKTRAKDDLVDAVRYAVARIPWNFEAAYNKKPEAKTVVVPLTEREKNRRVAAGLDQPSVGLDLVVNALNDAQDYYDNCGGYDE